MPVAATSPEAPREFDLVPADNARLANLCGPLDENLRLIEARLERARSSAAATPSASAAHRRGAAEELLRELFELARTEDVTPERVHLALRERESGAGRRAERATTSRCVRVPRGGIRARGAHQRDYLQHIRTRDLTFGIGPAGTGKTYLAVACAVEALQADRVRRIVLVRPAVEAGERLGFLPGDLTQKVDPYLRPMYDALYEMMGFDRVARFIERNVIEVAPLAFMRGRIAERLLHHPRRGAEHHHRADEDVPDAHRLRLARGGDRATSRRPICRAGKQSGLRHVVNVLRGGRGRRLHLLRCRGRGAPSAGAAHRAGLRSRAGARREAAAPARSPATLQLQVRRRVRAWAPPRRDLTRWAAPRSGAAPPAANSALRVVGARREPAPECAATADATAPPTCCRFRRRCRRAAAPARAARRSGDLRAGAARGGARAGARRCARTGRTWWCTARCT